MLKRFPAVQSSGECNSKWDEIGVNCMRSSHMTCRSHNVSDSAKGKKKFSLNINWCVYEYFNRLFEMNLVTLRYDLLLFCPYAVIALMTLLWKLLIQIHVFGH